MVKLGEQSSQLAPTLLDEGLVEDGGQGGVQLLLHVLQQHWGPKLDRIFQGPQEIRLLKIDDLQFLWKTEVVRISTDKLHLW